jgi:hypothetical protein
MAENAACPFGDIKTLPLRPGPDQHPPDRFKDCWR